MVAQLNYRLYYQFPCNTMPVIAETVNIDYQGSINRILAGYICLAHNHGQICPDLANIFAIEFVIKHPAFACRLLETQKTFSRKVP